MIFNKESRFFFLKSFSSLLISVVLFSLTIYVSVTNEYMKFRPVTVQVEEHLKSPGRYSSHLYLIVNNDEWSRFNVTVGPTEFATLKKGDRTVLSLREMDIRQTGLKNAVYFFGQVILWACSMMYFVFIVIYFFWSREIKSFLSSD